jgi:Family of unknown function (DUF5681)
MPFQKGQSGNPKGRRKGTKNKASKTQAEITALARGYSAECIERLMHWVRSDKSRDSVQAARSVLERAWGMPASHVECRTLMIDPKDGSGDKIEVTFIRPDPRLYADDPPRVIH